MVDSLRSSVSLLAVGLLVSALGCGDKAADGGAGSAKPATTSTAATAAKTAAPVETAKPLEIIDIDLESADPKWKGWSVKGPSDSKVLQDGSHGARIAGAKGKPMVMSKDGDDRGIDIAFAWGKDDLKTLKANLEKGAKMGDGKTVYTFTKEEPDALEWKSTYDNKTSSYGFSIHMNVEKTDVTCKSMPIGAGNEAELKRQIETCKTLAKKK